MKIFSQKLAFFEIEFLRIVFSLDPLSTGGKLLKIIIVNNAQYNITELKWKLVSSCFILFLF